MSFKWKTILGIAVIELLFLSILICQASRYIENQGEAAIEKRAKDTVFLADTVIQDALISLDLATLEEQVQQLGRLDGVKYASLERYGKTLAATDSSLTSGISDNPDTSVAKAVDGVFDIHHEIRVADKTLGLLRIGFSVEELHALTQQAQGHLLAIAFFELLLVGLCSWILAYYLTKRLLLLRNASQTLRSGFVSEPIAEKGNDEVTDTIRAFNLMSATLLARERALKQANRELLESNNKLVAQGEEMRSMFDAAPDGIAILDNEKRVVFANQNLKSLFEIDESFLLGRPIADFLGSETNRQLIDREGVQKGVKASFVTGSERTVFFEMNMSLIHMENGEQFVLIVRDKTQEHELAHAVLVSEQLKSNLVDSSLDALITINSKGKITDFSKSAESLFGWRKSEILGQSMEDHFVPEQMRPAHARGMAHFLATGEGPLIGKRVETTAQQKSGRFFPVELALTAIWIDGEPFVMAAIRDITERKEREQELMAAKIQAEEASTAKSRFLSYMSHEIRSPMNAVLGALELIHEQGKLGESERRYLELARQSGDSLLGVINEILDLSKIESGRIEFKRVGFSPAELIKSVADSVLTNSKKRGVDINVEFSRSIPSVIIADRIHLKQVLIILLDNARKFTEQGEVNLFASTVCLAGGDQQERLRIEVCDTGPGIPSDLLESIFLEFEQVDAARDSGFGGTGLGLAIAKKLVNGMGGTIWADSEVGVGSTFTFEIPFSDKDVTSAERCAQGAEENATGPIGDEVSERRNDICGQLILLVDDVEANLTIGAELLKSRGYRVDLAHDGLEAVERARETDYALILMDIRMPRMNGLEATEKIRHSGGINSRTPILALTANAETSEMKRCSEAGMNGFVSKPFSIDVLNDAIMRCLNENEQKEAGMQKPTRNSDEEREVMSMNVLNQLVKDTSLESLPMMISVFINEIKKRIEGINRAVESNDEAEIREQAHALKSCSGTFGGLRLQAAASELEDLASESSACSYPALVTDVRNVADETVLEYAGYREKLDMSSQIANRTV